MENKDKRFAVLIDADNISSKMIKNILDEIANHGTPTIKRIYGDFTSTRLAAWKDVLLENSINPIQQYAYTTGKNATDSALIIDAMDILHKENINGVCIVSSDSDYTRLASRIRESGKEVLGFGEKKTPLPFIKSCDKFIYVEILDTKKVAATPPTAKKSVKKSQSATDKNDATTVNNTPVESAFLPIDKNLKALLASTIDNLGDDNGWAFLGVVGAIITKKMPDFDPRNYGFKKLTLLIKSLPEIEIEERLQEGSSLKQVYVRNKSKK